MQSKLNGIHSHRVLLVFAFLCYVPSLTFAARAPNAVEKKVIFIGQSALQIAELLGLSSSGPSSISLQLGRGDAWAVYLLKRDTKEPLWNDNEGSPARYNTVEFSSSPVASVTISPFWLDLATRAPNPKPDYFSFASPFLTEKLDQNDHWTQIVKRLRDKPEWNDGSDRVFQRCFQSKEGDEFCFEVLRSELYIENNRESGYVAIVTVHLKNQTN